MKTNKTPIETPAVTSPKTETPAVVPQTKAELEAMKAEIEVKLRNIAEQEKKERIAKAEARTETLQKGLTPAIINLLAPEHGYRCQGEDRAMEYYKNEENRVCLRCFLTNAMNGRTYQSFDLRVELVGTEEE